MTPTLIYCAGGNHRFVEIALRYGYRYGAMLPNTLHTALYFADQDFKKYQQASVERRPRLRAKYMTCLAEQRPALATVLDWEYDAQLPEVLSWAEEAAQWVSDSVIIIPKVVGGIKRLPRTIGGKQVRLGYSASTTFSSTPVPIAEFEGWPVHCLGGSVKRQMHLAHVLDVHSVDGNYIQYRAKQYAQFYSPGYRSKHNSWPLLKELGIPRTRDAIYTALELSCMAVPRAWCGVSGAEIHDVQIAFLRQQGWPVKSKQLSFTW